MQDDWITLALRQSPDVWVVTDASGQIRHWSPNAVTVYGYPPEVAICQRMEDLVVAIDHRAAHRDRLAAALRGQEGTFESVRKRSDGALLYVDVSTRLLALDDGSTLVLFAEKDVTDLKVQRDAKLMEARFRELLESTPDGIVMANLTGHIVLANTQAERLFGYDPGELRGCSVDELLPDRYRHAHVAHRSQYFLAPRKRAMGSGLDLAGLRKDGSEFPIEISLSPLRADESAFVMSAIRDISERKSFERALQEKNVELANANQAKDRFLAGMSHELRTPLNAIIGFTGTLLMKLPGPLNPEQEKQLRTVQASGRHLLALINDLLDIAKIEAGKLELKSEPVELSTLLMETVATFTPQAAHKGIELGCLPESPNLCVMADRRAVKQIVMNLLGNAIKFTERGRVSATLGSITDDMGNRWAEIRVEDTGIGISPEDQARLFQAFSRVNFDRAGAADGTGLGLHLSQQLAHVMGGRIECSSEREKGSRFSLLLPGG